MPYCRHCAGEIQEGAVTCPHCQKPQTEGSGKGSKAPILIAVGAGCGCLVIFGGLIAAILIPNLLDALQKAKQKRTLMDVRQVGTAVVSWAQDEIGRGNAESSLPENPSAADLEEVLVPEYIQQVPATDAWKFELEFWINPDLSETSLVTIRSPGADGVFDSEQYEPSAFTSTDYDQDIVWADGYFLRYPSGYSPR